jgi:hypothetical protein
MSDAERRDGETGPTGDAGKSEGPNLKLIYSLIALALLAAMALAGLIVLPFYRGR